MQCCGSKSSLRKSYVRMAHSLPTTCLLLRAAHNVACTHQPFMLHLWHCVHDQQPIVLLGL